MAAGVLAVDLQQRIPGADVGPPGRERDQPRPSRQHGVAAIEREELLRLVLARERPPARARATAENHGLQVHAGLFPAYPVAVDVADVVIDNLPLID